MQLCAISFKECWQDDAGDWWSDGGFPLQMGAIASLFDGARLLVVGVPPRAGGLPIPKPIEVVPLPSPAGRDARRKLSVLARAPSYLRTFARHMAGADVVHTPLPGDLPLLAMLLAVAKGKRVVARYGGSWAANGQSTLTTRATRSLMKVLARGGNVMLATGDRRDVTDAGIGCVFSTALSARELAGVRPDLDRGLADPARLVYAGRLSPEKGVAVLLRALALLAERGGPAPVLSLLGDGPERPALERLVRELRLEERVRFLGQRDRATLSADFLASDLCVQPSLTEGFSKAWLDAMAHGLPVLASEVGAARSVIGEDGERGWLVAPGDPAALAARLAAVLGEPADWPALRRRCRAYTEGRTLEAWAREIGEICARKWRLELVDGKLR